MFGTTETFFMNPTIFGLEMRTFDIGRTPLVDKIDNSCFVQWKNCDSIVSLTCKFGILCWNVKCAKVCVAHFSSKTRTHFPRRHHYHHKSYHYHHHHHFCSPHRHNIFIIGFNADTNLFIINLFHLNHFIFIYNPTQGFCNT